MSQRYLDDSLGSVIRPYTHEQVLKLRGSVCPEHTFARLGANKLRARLRELDYTHALSAITGGQAVQQALVGQPAIYCSGWQVAADANLAGQTYSDQSLYPSNSVPQLVERLNAALHRADQIESSEGGVKRDWFPPIVADAEAGFGGPLNAFEMMKLMIKSGAAGVHYEDQLSSEKKCGHLGGKVLEPGSMFIRKLVAARLAADVCDVPTVLIARTDANSARLLTADIDEDDKPFMTGVRTPEGFFQITGGIDHAISRGLQYAKYADLLWCETSEPNVQEAQRFAEGIHAQFPGKVLAYNCSPSFNWKKKLSQKDIASFQKDIAQMGYKFQFVTLSAFHQLNFGMFQLALDYADRDMAAYADLQAQEFAAETDGYTATKHQREVGTGYFDEVMQTVTSGQSSTTALAGSTEKDQFH